MKQKWHFFNLLYLSTPSSCLLARLFSTLLIHWAIKSLIKGSQFLLYFFISLSSFVLAFPIHAASSIGKLVTKGSIFSIFFLIKSLFFLAYSILNSYLSNYGYNFLQIVINLDLNIVFFYNSISSSGCYINYFDKCLKVNFIEEWLNIYYRLIISFVSLSKEENY